MTSTPHNQDRNLGQLKWVLGVVVTLMVAQAATVSYWSMAGDQTLHEQQAAISSAVQGLTDRVVEVAELIAVTSDSLAKGRRELDGHEIRLRTVELWRAESQGNRYTVHDARREAENRGKALDDVQTRLSDRLDRLDERLRALADRLGGPTG